MRITDRLWNSFVLAPEGAGGGSPAGGAAPATGGDPAVKDDAGAGEKTSDATILYGKEGDKSKQGEKDSKGDPKDKESDADKAKVDKTDDDKSKAVDDDKSKDKAKDDDKEKKDDGKPAFDAAALKFPEGVPVDQKLLDTVTPILGELGVNTEGGQKLVDAYTEARKAEAEAMNEQWAETQKAWLNEAKSDPEIGKAKWDESAFAAQKAVKKFGTPALKEALEFSGMGNHPELIRVFARVGAMIEDDKPVIGAIAAGEKQDAVAILYPDSKG